MAAEETIHKAHLVGKEQTKAEAEQARSHGHPTIPARKSLGGVSKWNGDYRGNHHHPCNRANAEEQEIGNGPPRITNGCHHQQRDCRGACQPMDDTDNQGAQHVVQSQTPERPVEPSLWRGGFSVGMPGESIALSVRVHVVTVDMRHSRLLAARSESLLQPAQHTGEV